MQPTPASATGAYREDLKRKPERLPALNRPILGHRPRDTPAGVSMIENRHDVSSRFTRTIDMLTLDLGLRPLTELERAQMQETVAKARD